VGQAILPVAAFQRLVSTQARARLLGPQRFDENYGNTADRDSLKNSRIKKNHHISHAVCSRAQWQPYGDFTRPLLYPVSDDSLNTHSGKRRARHPKAGPYLVYEMNTASESARAVVGYALA
jgi:hypothetical protein